ncbi:unnamed protein product, partial [Meganyctiphanes norvegica]
MTVSAAADHGGKPLEVIDAIKGFMYNFFFCGDCRYHFLGMYHQTIGTYNKSVDTVDKAILWLWCVHNTVNEAWGHEKGNYWPKHPPFPLPGACHDCWDPPRKSGSEYTNCSALFCRNQQGDDICFSAKSEPMQEQPFPRTYRNFSMLHVLAYLKGVYSGPYLEINSGDKKKLTFRENINCPN